MSEKWWTTPFIKASTSCLKEGTGSSILFTETRQMFLVALIVRFHIKYPYWTKRNFSFMLNQKQNFSLAKSWVNLHVSWMTEKCISHKKNVCTFMQHHVKLASWRVSTSLLGVMGESSSNVISYPREGPTECCWPRRNKKSSDQHNVGSTCSLHLHHPLSGCTVQPPQWVLVPMRYVEMRDVCSRISETITHDSPRCWRFQNRTRKLQTWAFLPDEICTFFPQMLHFCLHIFT